MTIRPILIYPDAGLRKPALPVVRFDDSLSSLALDLVDTMRAANGIGITAAHIGISQRVAVIELPGSHEPELYINPVIDETGGDLVRFDEGSVSMPGISEQVERKSQIKLSYQDISGETHQLEAEGLLAICLQHEIDQLDGIFWLNRLSMIKRERAIKRFQKRLRQ
jgi:peptide deformylase